MPNVPNRPPSVKSPPALTPETIEALLALRVAVYGNEALALSLGERIASLPASTDLERAQALQQLAEAHAVCIRESLDLLLTRAGLLAA